MLTFDSRGDTIIEVLLAIVVFSMVSIGATTIMSQGTNAAQRSLEITQVRQQIDGQAEALRSAQQAYTVDKTDSAWQSIVDRTADTARVTIGDSCPASMAGVNGVFAMNAKTGQKLTDSDWYKDINTSNYPFAQVVYDGARPGSYGIWIERRFDNSAVASDSGRTPGAYEFTIRACWYGAGVSAPMTTDTVVRLYEP